MDNVEEDDIDLSVGKGPRDVDVERDICEANKDAQGKTKRKQTFKYGLCLKYLLWQKTKKKEKKGVSVKIAILCLRVTVAIVLEI